MKRRSSLFLAGIAVALAFGAAMTMPSSPASAQVKAPAGPPPGVAVPPPVVVVAPPKPVVVPVTPRPDFTRNFNPPIVPETPEIPTRPDPGFSGGGSTGARGKLDQLQSLTSIGQLMTAPAATDVVIPSVSLNNLENRMTLTGAADRVSATGAMPEGRDGALQALESAKPIL